METEVQTFVQDCLLSLLPEHGYLVVIIATVTFLIASAAPMIMAAMTTLWSILSDVGGIQSRSDRSVDVRARVHYACA